VFLPGRYRRRLQELYNRGDYEAAAALAHRYTKSFPNDPMGWFDLGTASTLTRDYATAEAALRRALEIKPHPAVTRKLANVLAHTGRAEQAEELLRPLSASLDNAERFSAEMGLAEAAVEEGRWADATQHAHAAQQNLGADNKDHRQMGLTFCVAQIPGQEEWAERLAREGIEGGEWWAFLILASLVEQRDPYEAADYVSAARKAWSGPASEIDEMLRAMRAERRRLRTIEERDT
jgi:tetratricopeptide (TPR) repeat protein